MRSEVVSGRRLWQNTQQRPNYDQIAWKSTFEQKATKAVLSVENHVVI